MPIINSSKGFVFLDALIMALISVFIISSSMRLAWISINKLKESEAIFNEDIKHRQELLDSVSRGECHSETSAFRLFTCKKYWDSKLMEITLMGQKLP